MHSQPMCRSCDSQNESKLLDERHKRYQKEVHDLAFGTTTCDRNMFECVKCHKELKSGIRWWVCGVCKGECKDCIHPPYVGKKRERDVEKAEVTGEQAEQPGKRRNLLLMFKPR